MIVRRMRRAAGLIVANGLSLILLAAPHLAAAGNRCANGGQSRPDEGGIGGTGITANGPDDEGGIGGTGIQAAITSGVIGTITGFASICVGNIEIHYDGDTPVHIDGRAAAASDLAIGHVVEIVARGDGEERHAASISLHHVVSGPITRVDVVHNEIDVIGQTVSLSATTRLDSGEAASIQSLPLNASVRISGLRRPDGVVIASHISRGGTADEALLNGPLSSLAAGSAEVGGIHVRTDTPPKASVGSEVRVAGHWDGTALVARSIEVAPALPFDGRVEHIDIEGYAGAAANGAVQVGAYRIESSTKLSSALQAGSLGPVHVEAIIRDHHLVAERVALAPDLPAPPPLGGQEAKPGADTGRPHDRGDHSHPDTPKGDGSDTAAPPPLDDHGGHPPGMPDQQDHHGPDKPEHVDHIDNPDRPNPPILPERPDHAYAPDRPDLPDAPRPPDRPMPPDHPGRPDLPDKPHPPDMDHMHMQRPEPPRGRP